MFIQKFTVLLYTLTWILSTLIVVSTGADIDCYVCDSVSIRKDCHHTEICSGNNPYCFTTKNAGSNFTLGCANETSSVCRDYMTTMSTTTITTTTTTTLATTRSMTSTAASNISTTAPYVNNSTTDNTTSAVNNTSTPSVTDVSSIIGRSIDYDDPTDVSTLCCNEDSCNKKLNPILKDECGDVNDGCDYLKEHLSICDKPHEAVNICKKTCNLCNYTDGEWSTWESWENCDVSCGNGTQTRSRTCTNPAPRDGGLNCTGDATETMECSEKDCPSDGNWSSWESWGACSATCGIGLRRRDRECSSPAPDPDGLFCLGDSRDDDICVANITCGDGEWENWESWSSCSSTCGVGLRTRNRNCSEMLCYGETQQSELCYSNQMFCKERNWTDWTGWSECSVSCGIGLMTRERNCSDVDTLFAKPCIGDARDFELCKQKRCIDRDSAFFVNGSPNEGSTNGSIVLPDVITDVGGDYDNTSGTFTCRIAGLYNFFISIEKQADAAQAYCQLLLNETSAFIVRVQSASFGGVGSLLQATNSAVLRLNPGDTVHLGMCSSPETLTKFCTFSGSLITLE